MKKNAGPHPDRDAAAAIFSPGRRTTSAIDENQRTAVSLSSSVRLFSSSNSATPAPTFIGVFGITYWILTSGPRTRRSSPCVFAFTTERTAFPGSFSRIGATAFSS